MTETRITYIVTRIAILSLLVIMILATGCTDQSTPASDTPTVTPTPTKDVPLTLVKMYQEGTYFVVIEITNQGAVDRDYLAVVNFYDGNVKLAPAGTHFPIAEPGETVRAKVILPVGTTRYSLDGVAITIRDQMYRIEYTRI